MFYLLYKHQWNTKKSVIYLVALATVIFSCVKICYFEFICDFARGGYVIKNEYRRHTPEELHDGLAKEEKYNNICNNQSNKNFVNKKYAQ